MRLFKAIAEDYRYTSLLLRMAFRFKGLSAIIVASTFLVSILSGIGVSLIIPFIQNIQNKNPEPFYLFSKIGLHFSGREAELNFILVVILLSTVLLNALTFVGEFYSSVIQEKIIIDLRTKMLEAMHKYSYRYFLDNPAGELSNVFMFQATQTGFSVFVALQFLMNLGITAVFMCLLLYLAPAWTLIVGIVFAALTAATQYVTKRIHHFTSINVGINEKLAADFVNDILGIKLIKVFRMSSMRMREYGRLFSDAMATSLASQKRISFVPPFMESVSVVFVMSFLVVLLKSDPVGFYANFPKIIAFFLIMQRMKTSIVRVNHYRSTMQRGKKHVYNIEEFLKNDTCFESVGVERFEGFKSSIEFRNVSFEYEKDKRALRDVSFTINVGETVALVGGSGAGKTTISDLLLKFIEPTSGLILVDGVDLSKISRADYYEKTGLVQQETFLFDNTIGWNIARGESALMSGEKIKKAAEFANISEFAEALENGYDTRVGDRGGKLSGGEKQRVGIARAVIGDPELIVMDEPTSALDSRNETAVIDSIKKIAANRTVVIITHKLSTVRHAAKIIVMSNGVVAGIGTHESLLGNETYMELLKNEGAAKTT